MLGLKYKNQERIFEEKESGGVPYLSYPVFEELGIVSHGFSTRLGGVSRGNCATMNLSTTRGDDPAAVAENTRRIAAAIGVDPSDMVYTHQTHTTNVAVVGEGDRGKRFMDTDGMVTDVPGICLVTFYADCVPLYFVDVRHKAIGLAHSGWRGTVGRIGKKTLEAMHTEYQTDPQDVVCAIGPSICQGCYEVSGDVAEAFAKEFPDYEGELLEDKGNGKYQLDLWRANERVLLDAGIRPGHIAVTNLCTCCHPKLLFSHRATQGKRGNLGAFLCLAE